MSPTLFLWAFLTVLWTAGGVLAWKLWRSYSKHLARGGKLPQGDTCTIHGRNCPGHLHLEILGDVVIFHYPDGTITAGKLQPGRTP